MLVCQAIRRSFTKKFVPPKDMLEHRYLIFPILHEQNPATRGMNHWTVVAVDTDTREWKYYNSLRLKTGRKGTYSEDTVEVVSNTELKRKYTLM